MTDGVTFDPTTCRCLVVVSVTALHFTCVLIRHLLSSGSARWDTRLRQPFHRSLSETAAVWETCRAMSPSPQASPHFPTPPALFSEVLGEGIPAFRGAAMAVPIPHFNHRTSAPPNPAF
ncbi:hypothetical protein MATL_G00242520 [Megalops atlanticus]|uniref:Uncharacterized protein n=1 Tax=Megalops atlanticus TaxID=7932 RepID=A0A9D3PCH6_MEGAT|nr:hypothetical protein MATL_G00242520 [Megalops atlanticus]